MYIYIQFGPKILGLFFKSKTLEHTEFFNSKYAPLAHIQSFERGCRISEKLPKIPHFGLSLIH